jgi:Flp pilus assembly protein TadG
MDRASLKSCRRGAVLVEVALILPVFCALVFGAIEYGWLFTKAQQVSMAARAGARAGALAGGTSGDVSAAVSTTLAQSGISGSQYTMTMSSATPDTLGRGQNFSVSVSVDYGQSTGGLALLRIPLVPVPDRLNAQCTMAKEAP